MEPKNYKNNSRLRMGAGKGLETGEQNATLTKSEDKETVSRRKFGKLTAGLGLASFAGASTANAHEDNPDEPAHLPFLSSWSDLESFVPAEHMDGWLIEVGGDRGGTFRVFFDGKMVDGRTFEADGGVLVDIGGGHQVERQTQGDEAYVAWWGITKPTSLTDTPDNQPAIQNMFDFVAGNSDFRRGNFRGDYYIGKGLTINNNPDSTDLMDPPARNNAQEYLGGTLRPIAEMTAALTINSSDTTINGDLRILPRYTDSDGKKASGLDYANRTMDNGIVLNAGRCVIEKCEVRFAKRWGVHVDGAGGNNSIACSIGHITTNACGSSPRVPAQSLSFGFTNATNIGGEDSITQSATIVVAALPPELLADDLIRIDGRLHQVTNIPVTLTLDSWLTQAAVDGDVTRAYAVKADQGTPFKFNNATNNENEDDQTATIDVAVADLPSGFSIDDHLIRIKGRFHKVTEIVGAGTDPLTLTLFPQVTTPTDGTGGQADAVLAETVMTETITAANAEPPETGSFAFTNAANIGAGGDQNATIDVEALPERFSFNDLILVDGRLRHITNVVTITEDTTLTLFPWVTDNANRGVIGEAEAVFGGGVLSEGGNSASLTIRTLASQNCAIAHWTRGLYGSSVDVLQAELGTIGWMFGKHPNQNRGATVKSLYIESTDIHVIQGTNNTGGTGAAIWGAPNVNWRKCHNLGAGYNLEGVQVARHGNFDITVNDQSGFFPRINQPSRNFTEKPNTNSDVLIGDFKSLIKVSNNPNDFGTHWHRDVQQIKLVFVDTLHQRFGYVRASWLSSGPRTSDNPNSGIKEVTIIGVKVTNPGDNPDVEGVPRVLVNGAMEIRVAVAGPNGELPEEPTEPTNGPVLFEAFFDYGESDRDPEWVVSWTVLSQSPNL